MHGRIILSTTIKIHFSLIYTHRTNVHTLMLFWVKQSYSFTIITDNINGAGRFSVGLARPDKVVRGVWVDLNYGTSYLDAVE